MIVLFAIFNPLTALVLAIGVARVLAAFEDR